METSAIVIDNGSGTLKAGFADNIINETPSTVIPCIVGRRKSPVFNGIPTPFQKAYELATKHTFYGHEATKGSLHTTHPIHRGIINEWDELQQLWHYLFENNLRVDPKEHSVLCTENVGNHQSNREKMTEIMFEQFDVPNFYVAIASVLSLYASGRDTGYVLDSGFGKTSICAIYEGYVLPHTSSTIHVSGDDITNYFHSIMTQKGYQFTQNRRGIHPKHISNSIKEELCICCNNNDVSRLKTHKYMLPDGEIIDIGLERTEAAEILFNPMIMGCNEEGIHKQICESIMKCDVEIREEMFENILLCGGNTMYNGMDERLRKEIRLIVDKEIIVDGFVRRYSNDIYKDVLSVLYNNLEAKPCPKIKVIAPPKRKYTSWIGGCIIAQLDTFSEMWITDDEYYEYGPPIVHRKCT